MKDLDLRLEVVSKSCQPLRDIRRWISRKPLEIEVWFQRTSNRKRHMHCQMVTWPTSRDPRRCCEAITVSYPNDSFASCFTLAPKFSKSPQIDPTVTHRSCNGFHIPFSYCGIKQYELFQSQRPSHLSILSFSLPRLLSVISATSFLSDLLTYHFVFPRDS